MNVMYCLTLMTNHIAPCKSNVPLHTDSLESQVSHEETYMESSKYKICCHGQIMSLKIEFMILDILKVQRSPCFPCMMQVHDFIGKMSLVPLHKGTV